MRHRNGTSAVGNSLSAKKAERRRGASTASKTSATSQATAVSKGASGRKSPGGPTKSHNGWIVLGFLAPIAHFVVATAVYGYKSEYVFVDGIFVALMLAGEKARQFVVLGFPFWLTGIVYDGLLPAVLHFRGPIHVGDLYNAELQWFGTQSANGLCTWSEYFRDHHWPAVDLICGFVYMCYIPEMVPFAIYLFFKDRRRLGKLTWIFCVVHLANFATYLLYPAAPPWYVEKYGLGPAVLGIPSDAAGFARVDQILGTTIVQWFYAHNANVFGAMPSGHVGSAVLFALVAAGMGWRWFVPAATFACLMAFGAVYFSHHYIFDVIAGCLYAGLGYCLVTAVEAWWAPAESTAFETPAPHLGEARC